MSDIGRPTRIKITIEPRWTTDIHAGEIELYERELEGKTPAEVQAYIDRQVAEYVSEECPYGWSVMDDVPAAAAGPGTTGGDPC